MTPDVMKAYDGSRNIASQAVRSMCYAPHSALYFDMRGNARACCWNSILPFGNVQTHTIDEIWSGAKAKILRRALESYDFSKGCGFCERQTEHGQTSHTVMRVFDSYGIESPDPQWPQRMDFSISNSCNLECIMCSGFFSSAIRAKREKLPPIQSVYSGAFIDSLEKYLPHLKLAKFLGGEPFLITEYYRIWDMMVEVAPEVNCHITTNGTQYNPRVVKFMEKLKFSFAVYLVGATRETVESIRVNANFDEQMEILRRLKDYTTARKTDLSLTFCFMRQNWHEFGEFCLMADLWGCNAGINTVNNLREFSVNNLPYEQLRNIVDTMEAQWVSLESQLKRNRAVWLNELDRLRLKLRAMSDA